MNKAHNSYYYTLGLQPGASPGEIKSAFRRLVKLYHADHDQSLDVEMKYKEIREAYTELIKQAATSKAGTAPNFSTQTAWRSNGSANSSKRTESRQYHFHTQGAMGFDLSDEKNSLRWNLPIGKLVLTMLGSIPLLQIETLGYVIIASVLIFSAFFLSFYLERYVLFNSYTVRRMYFWLPFTISAGVSNFETSSPPVNYFFLVILCILGLFMPLDFLMKDPSSLSD